MEHEATHRRPLLKAMVGGGLALGAVAGGARVFLSPDGLGSKGEGPPALELSADSGSDVRALEVQLGDELLPQVAQGRWGSTQLRTSTHSMVGFTWAGARSAQPQPKVQVRSRVRGGWTSWRSVRALHDLPDPGSGEGRGVLGTELAWIGDADGIQVQVAGARPADLTMVLLHPARRADDRFQSAYGRDPATYGRSSKGALTPTARPKIYSRSQWGADESWRDGNPEFCSTIQQVHVHHTVNSNDYAEDDVPALLRGIYRYHTQNLGWSDVGYNFLVDRFGRIWTGRAGGAAKAVRGAHTLGFNATSTGVSVIGNLDQVAPSSAVLEAIAQLAAWKLSHYGLLGSGTTTVVSEGSDKFRAGKSVTLPIIDGHRDTNDTACPGGNLYAVLDQVRARTDAIINAAQLQPMPITRPAAVVGTPVVGGRLRARLPKGRPEGTTAAIAWLRDGVAIPGATRKVYQPTAEDAGRQLGLRITLSCAGYETTEVTASAAGIVKVETTLEVHSSGRGGRVKVRARVVPVGMDGVPTGALRVKVNQRTKRVDLRSGRRKARFVGFAKGRYPVVVRYFGDGVYLPSRAVSEVRVR
ncbi:N-acetylmuramoyl-L-alanine amidase [Nocardioides sp.]|uniref:N-acetylmuramoyl-L-alanine amidase n=1 Tax=Nocardioides sp. TaxID=35761 RepID=UPI001A32A36D|nr:N-acetylmuramoyl-L-alanine amidase [Nocardioides sp.]MBJ7356867.1 N-acetylmuramoyl-L-alanine amidase [Nocardioides sp.]